MPSCKLIHNELNPQIVIEAKLTEDNGTVRDKATAAWKGNCQTSQNSKWSPVLPDAALAYAVRT